MVRTKCFFIMSFQIHETGRLLCVGASDGTTSLIQLDESLATCSKLDRTNANDMFDRLVGGKGG